MLQKIDKIRNYGCFKNFTWNSKVPNFNEYNLIYGWNYSGKTMFSRILRTIELKECHENYAEAEFECTDDNNKIRHDRLSNTKNQFRVFNTDFVKDNLHWDDQEAKPIFILGKVDIKLQKRTRSLKEKIDNLTKDNENKESEKNNLNSDLEKRLTEKARELDRIKSPYDKKKLKSRLCEIELEPVKYILNETDVQKLIKTLKTYAKDKLPKVSLEIINQDNLKQIKELLNKTVVSQAIETLANNPELNKWVKNGLILHKGKDKCEFCGGGLPENLLAKYEKHFSEEYENLIDELNNKIQHVEKYKINKSLPDEEGICPQLENDYKIIKLKLETSIHEYNENIGEMLNLIKEKINNPFKKFVSRIFGFDTSVITKDMKKLNDLLVDHNSKCSDFKSEQEDAFEKLELNYACEFNKEHKYFDALGIKHELEQDIKQQQNDIIQKQEEISKIELQLSDIAKAADRINQYLKSIFGKEHIRIVPSGENKFRILRGSIDAKNLSEGEKTSVAFSYFLTKLEDKETDLSKAIVFIDDPISSLDSNHLYNTFAVIQAKLEKCHQLFVSTHNLEFFNLIKEWLAKIKGNEDKCRFYLIERITKNADEVSVIAQLPSLLRIFYSEYHFLFYKIKSFVDKPTDFESLYQLPNIIRRFLEAFIGFKYAAGLKKGLKSIISIDSDRIKVDKFINILSHQRGLSRSLSFCDSNECKRVAEIVLESVKHNDSEHYGVLENEYINAIEKQ